MYVQNSAHTVIKTMLQCSQKTSRGKWQSKSSLSTSFWTKRRKDLQRDTEWRTIVLNFQRSEFNSRGCGKFIKNFKAEILLWPSGAFLCVKPDRGKHLTATEMKQNTIGFSTHKGFSFNCRKLKIHSRTRENYFAFGSRFCPQKI